MLLTVCYDVMFISSNVFSAYDVARESQLQCCSHVFLFRYRVFVHEHACICMLILLVMFTHSFMDVHLHYMYMDKYMFTCCHCNVHSSYMTLIGVHELHG